MDQAVSWTRGPDFVEFTVPALGPEPRWEGPDSLTTEALADEELERFAEVGLAKVL